MMCHAGKEDSRVILIEQAVRQTEHFSVTENTDS